LKQDEAIDKIRKLLKLSESPYQEEAKIALEKARKLMVQYHLEEHDLSEEQKDDIIQTEVKIADVMTIVWGYISRNNRCMCYFADRYNQERKLEHYAIVVGYKFDVECVCAMMHYITGCFEHGLKTVRTQIRNGETVTINGVQRKFDRFSSTKGLKNNYLDGFYRGLVSIIEEQNASSEYHLMVITPEEVKQDYKERTDALNMKTMKINRCYRANPNTDLVRQISHNDGRNAGKRNQIEG